MEDRTTNLSDLIFDMLENVMLINMLTDNQPGMLTDEEQEAMDVINKAVDKLWPEMDEDPLDLTDEEIEELLDLLMEEEEDDDDEG